MRDIREKEKKTIAPKKIGRGKFTWELDSHLLAKCESVLNSQKFPRQFASLSDLIKQSLTAYQVGKLKITKSRNLNSSKRQISVRLPANLLDFYESIPRGQRTELVELVLDNYLEQLAKSLKI